MENYKNKTIEYYDTGQIEFIKYGFGSTFLHRTNGPALIRRAKSGRTLREAYYVNNKIHRIDGPAIIRNPDSMLLYEEYWLNHQPVYIGDIVDCIRRSENKTETFVKILNSIKEYDRKKAFFTIAPNMFPGEIEEQILRNIELFI